MPTHKRDVDLKRCDELLEKIREYKSKLDEAHQKFEIDVITPAAVQKVAEDYCAALLEYEHHCGSKKIR